MQNTPPNLHLRRWYDHMPAVSRAIMLLETFPPYFLEIILGGMVEIAERDFNALEKIASIKSIGAERVIGLYKARQKQRNLDQSPQMHKIVNYLYVLDDDQRIRLGKAIQELVCIVYVYLKWCKERQIQTSVNVVQGVCHAFCTGGEERALAFLKRIESESPAPLAKQEEKKTGTGRDEYLVTLAQLESEEFILQGDRIARE